MAEKEEEIIMQRKLILCCCLTLFLKVAGADNLIAKVNFVDAAVLDVVHSLARQAGLDLVISGDSSLAQNRRTSVQLKNVTAEEAIDYVL